MMIDFEKVFDGYRTPSSFSLVDYTHPIEIYTGLDENGRKSVIIRSSDKPQMVKSTSAIEISRGQVRNDVWQIGFHLNQNSMSGLFYKFCDDIIESSRNLPSSVSGIKYICTRYDSWKKMFYKLKREILTENEILGLIGELLFLKRHMLEKYDELIAVNSWSGSDKTHKDFSIENEWFEIKSSKNSALTLKIHSLEQLDANEIGYLMSYEFEKMSPSFDGYSLNNVVRDVLYNLSPEAYDIVIEKLKSAGWEYNDEYDNLVFRLTSAHKYLVDEKFPKIKKDELSQSIVKVEYEILKRDLNKFVVEG